MPSLIREKILKLGVGLSFMLLLPACSDSPPAQIAEFLAQGDRQLAAGSLRQAIASYRMAFHQDSLNPDVLARLAKAYSLQENSTAADKYLRRALNITYQKGMKALEAGAEDSAVAAYEQTLQIFDRHPLAHSRLGEIYLARGHGEKALEHFEKAARANPHFPATWIQLGQIYASRGRLQDAREAFEQAIAADINSLEAYLGLGSISMDQQNWTAAAAHFNNALKIDPQSAVARTGLQEIGRHL